jgi:hypothetical protein
LEEHKLGEKIEKLIVNKLNENGLIMRGEIIMDVAIVILVLVCADKSLPQKYSRA